MTILYMLGDDGAAARQWELGEEPLIVGRGGAVDVRVDDDGMSRRHFAILREGEAYLIKDLSSRNGTWVQGQRSAATRLQHNDRILAGRTMFRFSAEAVESASLSPVVLGPHGTVVISAPLSAAA